MSDSRCVRCFEHPHALASAHWRGWTRFDHPSQQLHSLRRRRLEAPNPPPGNAWRKQEERRPPDSSLEGAAPLPTRDFSRNPVSSSTYSIVGEMSSNDEPPSALCTVSGHFRVSLRGLERVLTGSLISVVIAWRLIASAPPSLPREDGEQSVHPRSSGAEARCRRGVSQRRSPSRPAAPKHSRPTNRRR